MTAVTSTWAAAAVRTFPVVEVFGPTVQGEGPDAGTRAFFLRLGGCDYRCSWCDSLHAVTPSLVRQAPRLTPSSLMARLDELGAERDDLVVLSGGNPALHKADGLLAALHREGLRVSVETQGSYWRGWLANVERLVVSPKPPSSGMATHDHGRALTRFLDRARVLSRHKIAVKVVVFDEPDYVWAKSVMQATAYLAGWQGLSCGTDAIGGEPLTATARRYRWLAEKVAADPDLKSVVVLPQLHVVAWGHALGR